MPLKPLQAPFITHLLMFCFLFSIWLTIPVGVSLFEMSRGCLLQHGNIYIKHCIFFTVGVCFCNLEQAFVIPRNALGMRIYTYIYVVDNLSSGLECAIYSAFIGHVTFFSCSNDLHCVSYLCTSV